MASSPTTEPIAIAAVMPFSFAPCDTLSMVSIRMAVRMISRKKLCDAEPAGRVMPSLNESGNRSFSDPLAVRAPSNCAARYAGRSAAGKRPATAKPMETAGLKCAPLTSPKV